MNTRSIGLGLAFLLSGCAATVQTDDAVEPSGTSTAETTAKPTPPATSAEASANPTSLPVIAPPGSAEAPKPNPNGKPDGSKCGKADDCQSGVCEGEGCDPATTKAVCVAANRMCTRDYVTYCGCDGKAFGGSGSCPGRLFANRGDCK